MKLINKLLTMIFSLSATIVMEVAQFNSLMIIAIIVDVISVLIAEKNIKKLIIKSFG